MITQEQIAKELGLSVMTVYRCLSGNGCVSAATKKRVEEFMRSRNYRPNLMAQSLKRQSSNIIGLVVPSFSYSYYPEVIDSIRTCLGLQYNLVLALSGDDPVEERKALEMLLGIPVAGILISPAASGKSVENCRYIADSQVPFVMFDRYFSEDPSWSYVAADCFAGAAELVRYLFKLGHRKIAHIGGSEGSFAQQIFEGYCRGLEECQLPLDISLVIRTRADEKSGALAAAQLLSSGKEFTAIHTASDPLAMGVMTCCRERNVAIPERISVTGFSDIMVAKQLSVPLTTFREPTAEIGAESVRLLLEKISGTPGASPGHLKLPGVFVERSSCKAI
ncbi:MAG: LacI family DNA-binding transcriptional regulator [Lentisphaeria bacterium]|nr:LacI family DNA-binding transcriptional regulator [Lentisphaeria bacterium]